MTLLHTIIHPSRIHDILFCHTPPHLDNDSNEKGELLLVGAEDRKLSVYWINPSIEAKEPPKVVAEMVGHKNRFVVILFGFFILIER